MFKLRFSELVKKDQDREIQRIHLAKLTAKFSNQKAHDQLQQQLNATNTITENNNFSSMTDSAYEPTPLSQFSTLSINKSQSAYNLNNPSTANSNKK